MSTVQLPIKMDAELRDAFISVANQMIQLHHRKYVISCESMYANMDSRIY